MKIPSHITPILSLIEPTKDWGKMKMYEWLDILYDGDDTTINYLPMDNLSGSKITRVLKIYPNKIRDTIPYLEKICPYDWVELLSDQPGLAEYCDWSKMSPYYMDKLLIRQPSLKSYHCFNNCLIEYPPPVEDDDWIKLDTNQWEGVISALTTCNL